MIKKHITKLIAVVITLTLLAALSVPSFAQDDQNAEQEFIKGVKLGFYLGFFHKPDELSKELYGTGNLIYGGYFAFDFVWRFEVRVELNRFKDKGTLSVSEEEIQFSQTQYRFGTRFRVLGGVRKINPYIGTGIGPSTYKEEVPERLKDYSGTIRGSYYVETGVYSPLKSKLHLDFNIRYIKADVDPFDEVIHLGGIRFGFGIEYRF
ncbi:outer membrane beta-barrel protein [Acidobacteriota bacterium]